MLNELTDLPDDAAQISARADLNARIRTEGTRNLIEAARRAGRRKSWLKALPGNYLMGPMPKLSLNWSVPFSPRAVLCCAMDSSTGLARITSSNHPRASGSYRQSCRTNGGCAGRAHGHRRHYRLSARITDEDSISWQRAASGAAYVGNGS